MSAFDEIKHVLTHYKYPLVMLDVFRAEVRQEVADWLASVGEKNAAYLLNTCDVLATGGDAEGFVNEDKARCAWLLNTIRTHGGRWTRARVVRLYAEAGAEGSQKSRARRDLHTLHVLGHLTAHGPQDGRFYLFKKGGQR